MKIAIQGVAGSSHHIAAQHYYSQKSGEELDFIFADTFAAVFTALNAKLADAAIIAIENSLYGSITEVYSLLQKYRYPVVGEVVEQIDLTMIAFPGTAAADIRRVYSHPVALAQCAHTLAAAYPKAEVVHYHDTAAAVEYIKHIGDHSYAAIAAAEVATQHDMVVLQSGIQDEPDNYTRFFAVEPNGVAPADADKATLILTISDGPGSLHRVLSVFADLGSNLTKIRSRVIPGKTKQDQFYVDLQITPAALATATEMLALQDCGVVTLGMYRAAESPAA